MTDTNTELFDLLNSALALQNNTFTVTLTNGKSYKLKQLTTKQLKELIKNVIDNSIASKEQFNLIFSEIIKENILDSDVDIESFNTVDLALCSLALRVNSVSSKFIYQTDEQQIEINLDQIYDKLIEFVKNNTDLFQQKTSQANNITIVYGLPLLSSEKQLITDSEYIEESEDEDEIKNYLGKLFINEITKAIYTITIDEKTFDLTKMSVEERIKVTELLPVSVIEPTIQFLDAFKKSFQSVFVTPEGITIPVDGTLFSSL